MNAGMIPFHTKLACAALALVAVVTAGVAYIRQQEAALAGGGAPVLAMTVTSGASPNSSWAVSPATRVTTLAGDGSRGLRDGAAAQARYVDPFGVALDRAGNVYLSDAGDNNRIRKINSDGVASTLAGSTEGYADGAGAAAQFNTPSGVAIDSAGNLYVADTGNNAIRKLTPEGVVSTLAGDGVAGFRDGKGAAARFNGPLGVAVDRAGVVYVADSYNDRIRRIAPDGTVTTLAGGGGPDDIDGPALQARFDTPCALAVAADGTLLIADTRNNAIRKLGIDGQVSTIASVPATERDRNALLRRPIALALAADGTLYIASAAHGRVMRMTPDGRAGRYRPSGASGLGRLRRRRQRAPVRPARHGAGAGRRTDRGRRGPVARAAAGAGDGRPAGGSGFSIGISTGSKQGNGVGISIDLAARRRAGAYRADVMAGPAATRGARSGRPDGRGARQFRRREPRPLPRRPRRAGRRRHAGAGDRRRQGQRSAGELGLRHAERRPQHRRHQLHPYARGTQRPRPAARRALPAVERRPGQAQPRARQARHPLRDRRHAGHRQRHGPRAPGLPPQRRRPQSTEPAVFRPA